MVELTEKNIVNLKMSKFLFLLFFLFLTNAGAISSTDSISVVGIVPVIMKVEMILPDKVHLMANAPRMVLVENGELKNCDTSTQILDIVCEIIQYSTDPVRISLVSSTD
jgi:hypothetical protein